MCGIAGFLQPSGLTADARSLVIRMTDAIRHRGPDDEGVWLDEAAGVALGHRRLAIIDLSSAGHQPMTSASGRYVTVYNGEIYNYRDLRAELEAIGAAPAWLGHSDTEVILAAVEKWGFEGALDRLNGMFALAVWDRRDRVLRLGRDRMGEKPLYYGRSGNSFLFGSELKALTAHPDFERRVNRAALTLYLRHNYIPAPFSIWEGIHKLPAGHYLEIREGGRVVPEPKAYWDFRTKARAGMENRKSDGPHLVDELETLLLDAVKRRMEADVPLGAFLSGGIDSSTTVALMQAQSGKPVRTFTIGFHEEGYNEAEHAKAVARHLGTDHTELYVEPEHALAIVPRLPSMWDEPFSDSSQIPTFLVSEMTRKHVTVSLSGDGGDELFGGYSRYFMAMRLWNSVSALPAWARPLLAKPLKSGAAAAAVGAAMRLLPPRYRHMAIADRLPKVAQVLEESSPDALYRRLISHFNAPEEVVIGGAEPAWALTESTGSFPSFAEKMMYLDTLTYLPDDILVKVDRASMAVSLESRVPFLDHRVVEFAWTLPLSAKIDGGSGKRILRDVLYRYVPEKLVERPKMGFGVPIGEWLKGPLRPWAEDLLSEERLTAEGFFNPAPIRKLWAEHQSGSRHWHYYLWDILMFQAWWAGQKEIYPTADRPLEATLAA